jgi:hypothetical protein
MAEPQSIDWPIIEAEYRAGIKTLRQLAEDHGITHGAINKRAKRDGWDRDLSAKIRAKADALVSKSVVSIEVSKKKMVSERMVVDTNADQQAGIRIAHRKDIERYRTLCQSLLAQLEAETGEPELFEGLGDLLAVPDDKGMDKLNEAYRKAISLPARIDGVKKLADTLKTLIGLEREAFGIDSRLQDKPPEDPQAGAIDLLECARIIAFTLARASHRMDEQKPLEKVINSV